MKDLKFKQLISRLGDANCILCKTKTTGWTDILRECLLDFQLINYQKKLGSYIKN